jgi:hypothetical protein
MTPHRRLVRAAARTPDPPQPVLRFCAVCHVSISREEIDAGRARPTRGGHLWCGVCVASTPEERARRRAALEAEFADDAPIPAPAPIPGRSAAAEPPPLPAAAPRATARPDPSRPPMSASEVDVVFLDRRVGELERAAFRLQSRLQTLEERIEELQRRGGA